MKSQTHRLHELHCRRQLLNTVENFTKPIAEKNVAFVTRVMNMWTEVWATGAVALALTVG